MKSISLAGGARSLSPCVQKNIALYDRPFVLPKKKQKPRKCDFSDAQRGRAAEQRLASSYNLRGAIRLLSPAESLISPGDRDAQREMISKHPPPWEDDIPPSLHGTRAPRHISAEELEMTVTSFPPGSSGGLDGLTTQHIRDLLYVGGELRRLLLERLAQVCDIIARGKIPDDVWNTVLRSWLVVASKPSGNPRPIAVGSTLRPLTAKVLLARVRVQLGTYLRPR